LAIDPELPKTGNRVGDFFNLKNMKYCKIISVIIIIAFSSCQKSTFITNKNTPLQEESATVMPIDDCPEGQHLAWFYEFNGFNFHRPKFNCNSGFWFCFRDGHWVKRCVADNPSTEIKTNSTVVWGKMVGSQFEIHFPAGLQYMPGNSPQDFQTFSVDDEYEIDTNLTLAKGSYTVSTIGSDFVVLVNIL